MPARLTATLSLLRERFLLRRESADKPRPFNQGEGANHIAFLSIRIVLPLICDFRGDD